MPRILGIDYGEKRIGLAVSDPNGRIALPVGCLTCPDKEAVFHRITDIVREKEVEFLVIGLPLSLMGGRGVQADKVKKWAAELGERLGLPVVLWDERYTSKQAARELSLMGRKIKNNKGKIDQMAATFLLQSYLDSIGRSN